MHTCKCVCVPWFTPISLKHAMQVGMYMSVSLSQFVFQPLYVCVCLYKWYMWVCLCPWCMQIALHICVYVCVFVCVCVFPLCIPIPLCMCAYVCPLVWPNWFVPAFAHVYACIQVYVPHVYLSSSMHVYVHVVTVSVFHGVQNTLWIVHMQPNMCINVPVFRSEPQVLCAFKCVP